MYVHTNSDACIYLILTICMLTYVQIAVYKNSSYINDTYLNVDQGVSALHSQASVPHS